MGKNSKDIVSELLAENETDVKKMLNKKYSGGQYYPSNFSFKLPPYLMNVYINLCKDIVRMIYVQKGMIGTSIYMANDNITSVEKAPLKKTAYDVTLENFIRAIEMLPEETSRIAFEKACLDKSDMEIMEKYNCLRNDIIMAKQDLIRLFAYNQGEIFQ